MPENFRRKLYPAYKKKKPKIHSDDIAPEVKHKERIEGEQAVTDADMEEGQYIDTGELDPQGEPLKASTGDILSDINRQKQLRDAKEHEEFDKEMQAIDKAKRAGNLTDQGIIDAHKRAKEIRDKTGFGYKYLEGMLNNVNIFASDMKDILSNIDLSKTWDSAKTVDNWYNPFEVGSAAAAHTAEFVLPQTQEELMLELMTLGQGKKLSLGRKLAWALLKDTPAYQKATSLFNTLSVAARGGLDVGTARDVSGKRRPTDWSDVTPSGRPSDVDADQLGETIYATQWKGISNELDYDFSKVSTIKTKPSIKSQNGNTVPAWVGTPIVRNAEQFLKDNPTKNLDSFPLTKWDGDYWVPKIRTRPKVVDGKKVKQSYIGLDRWDNRTTFRGLGKASRKRKIIEQSEGVAPGTRAKAKIDQLNEFNKKRKAVGRRPLSMSEVQIDHVNALNAYDMYTDGLPKDLKDEFKALLAKENLTTGDNIGNLKLRETKIHSRLWPALRARLKALGHKYKSYEFRSPQERMKYYKEINTESGTGVTRIEEFAEAIHKIDEEGTDLMNDLLKPIPKGKKTVRVKKSTKDLLVEILGGGDLEEGTAAYRKLMNDLKDIPANVKEEFIMDAIENASN